MWNSGAGSAGGWSVEDVERRVAEALRGDVTVTEVTAERSPGACARAAVEAGADVVVAAGGDGTVSAVAAELVGRDVALGVLPVGTSNSFAAALGLPPELDGAIAALALPDRRRLDVAIARGAAGARTMILHCMIGFHADAIDETSDDAKRRWGVLAYLGSALRRLGSLASFAAELEADGRVIRCRANAIAVANLAPRKTVLAHGPSHLLGDDGRVDVTIVAADTISEALATGLHLWRTAGDEEPAERGNVGSLSVARVTVRTDPPQRVVVDGEPLGETPVTIETRPRALQVIAPAVAHAEGTPIEASLLGLPDLAVDAGQD